MSSFSLSRRQALLAAPAMLAAPAIAQAQPRAIKLGIIQPVTGALAQDGEYGRLGAELAIADINAGGGIKALGGDIETLKKQGDPAQAIRSLEQDLLVLRSELDNRPAASAGPNTAEFDAFRAQMTRNINTLQSQVMNLQQQINQR